MKRNTLLIAVCFATFLFIIVHKARAQQSSEDTISTLTGDQCETSIAIDPTDDSILWCTWYDFGDNVKPAYAYTTDGGSTWSTGTRLRQGYFRGENCSGAIDSDGNAYLCYFARQNVTKYRRVIVSKTTNGGDDWERDEEVWSGTYDDKPYIAVDNTGGDYDGYVYVSWTECPEEVGCNKILFSYSSDGGANFSQPETLDVTQGEPGSG